MPKFCGSMVPRFTTLRCLNVTLPEYLLIVFCAGCGVGIVAEVGVVDGVHSCGGAGVGVVGGFRAGFSPDLGTLISLRRYSRSLYHSPFWCHYWQSYGGTTGLVIPGPEGI